MNVRLGINPLTWSNDDMPSLGAEIPLETCLREARAAGYEGVELGHKFPRRASELGPILADHDLALASGHPAMLEIDLQGARQVRETMPEALFVFLEPPSWDELVRRLVGRGTEEEAERERRLATAREELAAKAEFDVSIVNREVHAAAEELVALMKPDQGDSV